MKLVLENSGIRLRPFVSTDITDKFVSWLNDPAIVKYSNQRFGLHTRESCLNYLHSFYGSDNLYFAIEHSLASRVCGSLTIYRQVHHETADIGIMVGDRDSWGQGIGYRAWSMAMSLIIDPLNVRKVTAGTLRSNDAMIRIIKKSGMTLEAVRYGQELVEGIPTDLLYFCRFLDVKN